MSKSKVRKCDGNIQLPFAIDRNGSANLPEQVAEGFRKAIRSGHYQPGDILPSRGEIAHALDISVRIPREAMAILAAENLVRPRRGIGCSVMAPRETLWKGRILIVERHTSEGSYFCGTMMAEVRRQLSRARYLYSYLSIDLKQGHRYAYDTKPLKEALLNKYDVALAVYPDYALMRLLRKHLPTICVDGTTPDAETIHTGGGEVPDEILSHCRETGVHNILYIGYNNCNEVVRKIRRAGFKVEYLHVDIKGSCNNLEDLEHKSFELCMKRFLPKHHRPDLIYFGDDYVARGGLMALLACRINVPEDIKVATLSNKGFSPVFPISLARYEHDPIAFGAHVANCLIAKHEHIAMPNLPTFRRYLPGASFP